MKKMLGIIMMVLLLASLFNQNQTVYANEGADYSVSPIFQSTKQKQWTVFLIFAGSQSKKI